MASIVAFAHSTQSEFFLTMLLAPSSKKTSKGGGDREVEIPFAIEYCVGIFF